jgi:hypothetical protein
MKIEIALPLALGIALAAPTSAYADLSHYRPVHHRTVVARADAPAPPIRYFVPSPWPYPFNYHETDGLSRNPDDCVKYGCVDNNG